MILIGITLFSIILGSAYNTFDNKQAVINNFEFANNLLNKICSPNVLFTQEINVIHLQTFISNETAEYVKKVQQRYASYDITFVIKLSTSDNKYWQPTQLPESSLIKEIYSCSKQISIKTNDVTTIPGEITVLFWKATPSPQGS